MCVHASHPTSESQWRVNLIYTRRRKRGGGGILLSFIVSFRSYCGGKFDIALKRGNKKKKKKTSWIYIGGQTHKTFFLRLPTCRYIDAALFLTSKIVVHPYPPLLLPCCCWNNLLWLFTIFFFSFLFLLLPYRRMTRVHPVWKSTQNLSVAMIDEQREKGNSRTNWKKNKKGLRNIKTSGSIV